MAIIFLVFFHFKDYFFEQCNNRMLKFIYWILLAVTSLMKRFLS